MSKLCDEPDGAGPLLAVGVVRSLLRSVPVPVAPAASVPVYSISVAAELAGCGIQALRLYEARGLLEPARTAAGTRRYSLDNVAQVRRITGLLDAGLNLTGIGEILAMEAENAALRAELARVKAQLRNRNTSR